MKLLKMQPLIPEYYVPIQKDLERIFFETIFKGVIDIVKDGTTQKVILNAAIDPLEQALRTGRIQYTDGVFSGKFSAAISKALREIGARFYARSGTYRIEPLLLPANVRVMAAQSTERARLTHELILRKLDEEQGRVDDETSHFEIDSAGTVNRIHHDFSDSVRAMIVTPELTEQAKKNLAADYNKNMDLYIRKFSSKKIEALRDEVEQNAQAGYRFESLIDRIKSQYGTSVSKAEFLARQETGLFMAKFRRENLAQKGVEGYIWHARSKALTRPSHWALNGRLFRYDQPPIVDQATGRKANPGEDFGCLCADRPVLGSITDEMTGRARIAA